MRTPWPWALIAASPALFAPDVHAAELWVDTTLPGDCADYDPATRSCGGGTDQAFATLTTADAATVPGDVVTIREATFTEPFVVTASGAEEQPIVFRAHDGEAVVFTGIDSADGAIWIEARAWLEIEGFTIEDVGSWIRVVDSQHVVIRGNTLARATIEGTRGSVKLLRSDDCTVVDNVIADGNDNITIVDSDRNRVLDNHLTGGRHSLISVRCSNANVFRGNYFDNPIQKATEVYDCEGSSSDDPVIFDATLRNLWERNEFAGTAGSDASHDYNAMQLAGQDGLVRRNVYHHNQGGGVHLQVYADEALANHGNRVYHNTLHANLCFALGASAGTGDGYFDNVLTANLLLDNADCAGGGEQIAPGDPTAAVFADNTLALRDPGFVDAAAADYRLTRGSTVIDAGPWLTAAVGAGEGTELVVADARWFFDGGGVPGEQGDRVQLEGDTATARVVAVDLEAGVLMLDGALSWSDGQGVALAYAGLGPDPGAFEQGLPDDGGSDDGGVDGTGGDTGGGADTGGTGDGGSASGGASASGGDDGGSLATDDGGSGSSADADSDPDGGCACDTGGGRGLDAVPLGLLVLARPRRIRRPVAPPC